MEPFLRTSQETSMSSKLLVTFGLCLSCGRGWLLLLQFLNDDDEEDTHFTRLLARNKLVQKVDSTHSIFIG